MIKEMKKEKRKKNWSLWLKQDFDSYYSQRTNPLNHNHILARSILKIITQT